MEETFPYSLQQLQIGVQIPGPLNSTSEYTPYLLKIYLKNVQYMHQHIVNFKGILCEMLI